MAANKIRVAHAIMAKLGIIDQKTNLLAAYNVDSMKDLTDQQLDDFISSLIDMRNSKKSEEKYEQRKWRSNVLSQLNHLGIYNTNNDWETVNSFLMDKRICGKLLYQCSVEELKKLHTKLLAMVKKKQEKDKTNLLTNYKNN